MINIDLYIADSDLLIIKWRGKWSVDDYMGAVKEFLSRASDIELQNVIHDITDLEFSFRLDDIKQIADIKRKYINTKHSTVYITAKPQDVVFAQLFADEFKDYRIYHCATINRAIQILGLENNSSNIKSAFSKLKF